MYTIIGLIISIIVVYILPVVLAFIIGGGDDFLEGLYMFASAIWFVTGGVGFGYGLIDNNFLVIVAPLISIPCFCILSYAVDNYDTPLEATIDIIDSVKEMINKHNEEKNR